MTALRIEPHLYIDIYSHAVRVYRFNQHGRRALLEYCLRMAQYDLVRNRNGGYDRQIKCVYVGVDRMRTEFRFHINQYEDLRRHLSRHGFTDDNIQITHHPLYEPVREVFVEKDTREPRDYQVPLIQYLVEPGAGKVVTLQTGRGKEQSLDSLVKIPGGWKRMGDIQLGDTVTAYDGRPSAVVGVYPQGKKQLYRVTFQDGRSTEVGAEHLWGVYVDGGARQVLDTRTLQGLLGYNVLTVPLTASEVGGSVNLQVPRRVGSDFTRGELAFVPEKYRHGSTDQRKALLDGLLDGERGNCFTAFRTPVAELVQYLVRSLGGIAKLDEDPYHTTVQYSFPTSKQLEIASIEPSRVAEAQCIAIDHPEHLYVTDDFIVTHNTFVGLKAIQEIQQRTMLVIKGMYVAKWILDVEATFKLKPGDLMVVRGSVHFKALIALAQAGELEAKFIICTNKTMFNYLKSYEYYGQPEEGYEVRPEDLYRTLGVGVRMIDEVHQDYHCNFRQDLYTHVPKTISLSATLDSDDPFMNQMYAINWPPGTHAPAVPHDRFIAMKALWYSIAQPKKLRCQNHRKQYSHVMFEQSVMKATPTRRAYLAMILDIVKTSFVSVREPGQKMLVFCSTVELCTLVANQLALANPTLTVARYVQGDSYDDLLEADISVSTPGSAGTAVDIINLRVVLVTVALSSKQANIQLLGRTRRLKDWPDITPEFLFLAARELEKHRTYTRQKGEKLDGKVLSFREYQTQYRI